MSLTYSLLISKSVVRIAAPASSSRPDLTRSGYLWMGSNVVLPNFFVMIKEK